MALSDQDVSDLTCEKVLGWTKQHVSPGGLHGEWWMDKGGNLVTPTEAFSLTGWTYGGDYHKWMREHLTPAYNDIIEDEPDFGRDLSWDSSAREVCETFLQHFGAIE